MAEAEDRIGNFPDVPGGKVEVGIEVKAADLHSVVVVCDNCETETVRDYISVGATKCKGCGRYFFPRVYGFIGNVAGALGGDEFCFNVEFSVDAD